MWLGSPSGPMKSRMKSPSRRGHLDGGLADGLDDHGDRALAGIEVGHGERNALAMLVEASHDEMSGTDGARDIRRLDVPEKGSRAELFPPSDEKHYTPLMAIL
jgi:hypothetical protein